MLKLDDSTLLYKNLSRETLNLIQRLNEEQKPTFLIPTRFISQENAQLAYMLNEYYNYKTCENERKVYRSFFVNSRYEALQGAIKLIRHNGFMKKKNKVLILDPEKEIEFIVNPLGEEKEEDFLLPGITFVTTFEELYEHINQSNLIMGVILRNKGIGFSASECSKLIRLCRGKGIITLLDDPDHVPGEEFLLHELNCLSDMVILGESLTNYEIPFSLFSMSREVHKPWSSAQTCLLHSSTYSGNKLAVIKAKDTLFQNVSFLKENKNISEICGKIDSSVQETLKYFADYINPGMVKFYSLIGYDFVCKKGHESWLDIQERSGKHKQVLDAVSGGGADIRGHSPQDIVPDVIENHEENVNYWEMLGERFHKLFSFPYAFPAVSGATAVETAFILTLLALPQNRKRVIVFKDNYAGNTLVSLIGTPSKVMHNIFQPIYKNVTYIDPFQPAAETELISELQKGNVGLVWLEIYQGATDKEIPENILKAIQNYKGKAGYYIGVDEILMGFYRMDRLVSYEDTPIIPDVITFSKALSDGTYPMAATLVSEEIYKKANSRNSRIVSHLQNLYKNQVGAHIALNSINKLTNPLVVEKVKRVSQILKDGMEQLKKNSPYLKDIDGKGHTYHLCYKNSMLSVYFCKRALQKEGLFIYIDRLCPAVTISENDAEELIKRLKSLYLGVGNPFTFKIKSFFISISILKKLLF